MTGLGAGLVSAAGLIAIAAACGTVARMTRTKQLQRNSWFGLRTRATRSSDEAWIVGHWAARRLLMIGAIAAGTIALVFLVLGVTYSGSDANDAVPLPVTVVGYLLVLGLIVAGGVKGEQAARRVMAEEAAQAAAPPQPQEHHAE